jgi:chitinase
MALRISVLVIGLLLLTTTAAAADDAQPSYRIVAYYASWSIYDRQFFVTDIPADQLTHLNYAFFNISDKGECVSGDPWADTQFPYPGDQEGEPLLGNFKQLQLLKQAHPHLKTLMSVGGWSWSDKFSDVALTAESRARFARSCIALMQQYGFDGIDIDWEYPTGGGLDPDAARPEDTQNFTRLLAELRAQLDALGGSPHYLLTIAAPANEVQYANIELNKISAYLDWLNVMTYDFSGAWSAVTGFNAPLHRDNIASISIAAENGEGTILGYIKAGVPPEKLVLGVPFYGRGWTGVADTNHGLYQPYTSILKGTYGDGTIDYHDLADSFIGKTPRYWNDAAQVPWLYDAATGTMISYDDAESLAKKAEFVKQHGLGGVMAWELSADDPAHTLLNALYDTLRGG